MARLKSLPGSLGSLPSRVRSLPKEAERFYTSAPWRQLMASIKAQRGNWCQQCGAGGKGQRIIGDHKVERKDGGADLDPDNIELLCMGCHARKTANARNRRATGKSAD